ncbi:MAG: 50S ribosomal protein L3 [Patescibacteria group bacterium]
MKFILGKKEKMIEFFSEDGRAVPVTAVLAGPVVVTRVLEKSKDGYDAVQVSMEGKKKVLKEFRIKPGEKSEVKIGDTIDVSVFAPGDKLAVSGISKGKGFQGVVKRHGFRGGPRTHGQKHSEREPGSIGGGLRTHIPKGMRMGGRMGSDRVTQKNLTVVSVDKENNLLLVKGALPGVRGTLVEIISR